MAAKKNTNASNYKLLLEGSTAGEISNLLTAALTEEQMQKVIEFASALTLNPKNQGQPMTREHTARIIEFLEGTKQYRTLQKEERRLFHREGIIPLDCSFEIKWSTETNCWVYLNYNDELYDRFYIGDPVKTKDIAAFQDLPSKQEQKKLIKEFELKCKKWISDAVSTKFGVTLEASELEEIFLELFY